MSPGDTSRHHVVSRYPGASKNLAVPTNLWNSKDGNGLVFLGELVSLVCALDRNLFVRLVPDYKGSGITPCASIEPIWFDRPT